MDKKFVEYKGRRVIEGWPEKIEAAQREKTYLIGKVEYDRIPYGQEAEDYGANSHHCGDCAVLKGELHVTRCDIEQCPLCDGQVITCDCDYDGDEDEEKNDEVG